MTRRKKEARSTRAVGYARVSTGKQAQNGISLEHQADAIKAYCEAHGLTLVELVVDAGHSAYKQPLARRADGRRVCELVRSGQVEAVVALRLDRLFRSIQDCINTSMAWDKADVALHLLDMGGQAVDTSTPMGRMLMAMMAGFAEMESYAKAERTRDAWDYKRARGQRLGSKPPYGYRMADGIAVLDADEQETLDVIIMLRRDGMSYTKIAEDLTRRGYRPRGARWHPTTIQRILNRTSVQ
ncbi:MAG: recombinase family protein [Armatimonadetes bacterium]|nr:recombinase family protein [Armatimonadota bacterium]